VTLADDRRPPCNRNPIYGIEVWKDRRAVMEPTFY
jgi:hypothetical protein